MNLSPALIRITLGNNGTTASSSSYITGLIPRNVCRPQSMNVCVRVCVCVCVCVRACVCVAKRSSECFTTSLLKKMEGKYFNLNITNTYICTPMTTLLPQFKRTRKPERTEWHGRGCLSLSSCRWWPCLTLYPFWNSSLQDFFRLHVSGRVSKLASLCVRRYTSSFGGIILSEVRIPAPSIEVQTSFLTNFWRSVRYSKYKKMLKAPQEPNGSWNL